MTTAKTESTLKVERVTGSLGAVVHSVNLMDESNLAAIRAALLEHLVLFFPDQHLDPDQHRRFAANWGEMEIHPYLPKVPDYPEVVEIRGAVSDVWHTDVTFSERPPIMSILNMVCAAPGGDTMWANSYAAYEGLSAPLRDLLDGVSAIHTGRVFGHPENQAEHPAVRVHPETGRRCLYVNEQFTERFPQLSRDESDMLLRHLWRFTVQPRFTVRWRWQTGTVAIWDNRCTQHFVVNDIPTEEPRSFRE